MLYRLQKACSWLGNKLDGTATHPHKYQYRQLAHSSVAKVIYGILSDDPENPQREYDVEEAEIHLGYLESLTKAEFSDRSGPGLISKLEMP